MDTKIIIGLVVYLLINISAFLVMSLDKNRSQGSRPRISEGTIFFWAICLGSIGVYLGMFAFRHKTRKIYFTLGIPLLILQNFTLLFFLAYVYENYLL
jgi:uncharacterized membrane protein YsdA (DUF1294 family)